MTSPVEIMHLYKKKRKKISLFRCRCGELFETSVYDVKDGSTKTCGCSRKTRGGLTSLHPYAYSCYLGMIRRCYSKHTINYKWYGGQGVVVYFDWLGEDGFANFLRDMGERQDGMSLERKDPSGNYEPDNCCWIPLGHQWKNKRPVHHNNR